MTYTFKHGDRPLEGLTVQRAVGRGGFGEVYYALTDSGKQVAVKYLRDNPDVELRGVAHVMNLKSPHLITIYDVRHNQEGEPFVIMEYVSGPSLRDLLIAEPNGLGPQKAAFFVDGVAKGLTYLHERGIVHRDLKPGNIFYDDGYVKIGDYGLSKHIAVSAHSGNTISVGTVHYMAPEIGSGSYTKSIDIYALGVMLYEMLTGRLPFTGSSMGEVLMRHLSDKPDVSGIPQPFAGVIAKALSKEPADRYSDVNEMVDMLTATTAVSEDLASFDASVLAQTPGSPEAADFDRTRTTPPKAPRVPVLDAREAEGDLPPIPPIPAVLGKKAAKRAHKLQKKAHKFQVKMEKKGQVVRAKLADLGLGPAAGGVTQPVAPAGRGRWRSALIALIVLFAASGGLGVGYEDGVVFGASLLYLLGGTIGTLLAYALSVRRNAAQHDFQDRLLYTACGFVFMLPAFAAGHAAGWRGIHEGDFAKLIIPLTAMLLIFNWTDRIQMGRRQIISGGTVFWHGVVGAIGAAMVSAEHFVLASAILAGAHLILVQSLATLWPLPVAGRPRPVAHGPRRGAWERVEGAYQRVTAVIDNVSNRIDTAGKSVEKGAGQRVTGAIDNFGKRIERAGENLEKEIDGQASDLVQADGKAAREKRPTLQPAILEGYQPSFVGRTANAGLSFVAKLLLLTGLTVACLYSAELVDIDQGGLQVMVGRGRVLVADRGCTEVDEQIPPAAAFAPLLLGSVLLIVARRNDGTAHFLRGFVGCLLACIVAVLALGPLTTQTSLAFAGKWEELRWSGGDDDMIVLGLCLVTSLLLMFWPKPVRRGEKPLVI